MPKCDCEKDNHLTPQALEIHNHECPVLFHKVLVPAAMGDDIDNPPRNGQYRNVLLQYEANKHIYMFSSDGIPTYISDGGQGVDDYNELENKPSINGHELIGDSSLEDIGVDDAIADALEDYTPTSDLAEVALSGDYNDLSNTPTIPVVNDATLTITRNNVSAGTFTANSATDTSINIAVPTATSDLTNDSGFITSAALPTKTSDLTNDGASGTSTYVEADDLATVATSGSYTDLSNRPTIGNATLTIQKNGTNVQTFTANATSNKTANITVPTTAADVSALPASTKYGASITVTIDPSDYKVTTTLKDQDGNRLGPAQTIDLPLESVVVNGSYDSTNKKIVLTLQSGSTIDIPVGDLIAGLQSEITSTNKLSSDLVDDTNHTHKFVTAAQITKLNGIAAGAEVNVQSDWNQTTTTADDYIKNKPSLATVATSGSYNDLSNKPTIPAAQVNSDWNAASGVAQILNKPNLATVATSGSYNDLSDKPDIVAGLTEMSYGESNAWAKFITAYRAKQIVYCRASSNSNPATGAQGRKAFMAYVNNAENPTEVEFQYVRSVSTKTASQPVDQVFVYKLTNASGGTWTVATRNMGPKLAQGTNTTVSYSNGTYTISATQPTVPTKTSDLTNDGSDGNSTYVEADDLATVATTGSYDDLTNKPTIPTAGTITSGSTGYATGGDVYTAIGNVETILSTLNNGGGAQ